MVVVFLFNYCALQTSVKVLCYVSLQSSHRSAAIGLFKIGFKNPMGDQSDSSRPRLIITQSAGNYDEDFYYYKVESSDIP